jgi:hypothetical protein
VAKHPYTYINSQNWGSSDFNVEKAFVCSILSELIYEYKPTSTKDRVKVYDLFEQEVSAFAELLAFAQIIQQQDFRIVFIIESPDGITIGISVNRVLIVASRGTKHWRDWLINVKFLKTAVRKDGNKLHRGFDSAAYGAIEKIFSKIMYSDVPVYFTGHSLGGAMSAILFSEFKEAQMMQVINNNIIAAYTFGMPRFSKKLMYIFSDIHHVYNKLDIVPRIPPQFLNYATLTPEYSFESERLVLKKKRDKTAIGYYFKMFQMAKIIKYHDIALYKELIEKNLP